MTPAGGNPGDDAHLTTASARQLIEPLLAARKTVAQRTAGEVIASLDRTVARWLEPGSAWRSQAEMRLAETTGFSPAMIRRGLPLLLEPLCGEAIQRLLADELGDRARFRRPPASGPELILHILPGNIPALAASPICLSLAAGAATLVKPGSGDRWFPGLFAGSISESDPELGACVAVYCWRGGEEDIERELFARADVVEASGSDQTITALRARVPGRFIGHGSRISVAFLGHEVVNDAGALADACRRLAEDISLWDQQGCLSPQVVFVETERWGRIERVAGELGAALDRLARELPPRRPTLDEQTAVLRFRQEAEWRAAAGGTGRVLGGEELSWTLVIEDRPSLQPTCLQRTVRLQPVAAAKEMTSVLRLKRRWLEAAGLGVERDRYPELAAELTDAGVHWVCPMGTMQRPDLTWKPGGQPRVAGWFS